MGLSLSPPRCASACDTRVVSCMNVQLYTCIFLQLVNVRLRGMSGQRARALLPSALLRAFGEQEQKLTLNLLDDV